MRESNRKGDYLEFGVFQGASLIAAYKAAVEYGLADMRFAGFDSFQGLPRPRGIDAGGDFRQGDYACDVEQVRTFLEMANVPRERVTLVEGFYSRTLTAEMQSRFQAVRVALIDCDLYASTVRVLDFLEPLLGPGAVVMFDDWSCFNGDPDRGERRAFAEFQERTSLSFVPTFDWGGHGQAFAVMYE